MTELLRVIERSALTPPMRQGVFQNGFPRQSSNADSGALPDSNHSHDFGRIDVLPPRPGATKAKAYRLQQSISGLAESDLTRPAAPSRWSDLGGEDPFCIFGTPNAGPTQGPFTARQSQLLSGVRFAARSVTAQALQNLGSPDPYMRTLARRVFHLAEPDMPGIIQTVSSILGALRSVPIVAGTCADAACREPAVVAHVLEDLSTVIICPRFFLLNVTQMRRTLIHEAGHAVGIDSSLGDTSETYCRDDLRVECQDPCGNLSGDLRQNVDAWARFIECAAFAR